MSTELVNGIKLQFNDSMCATNAVAPHSRSEHLPESLQAYDGWRLNHFNVEQMPHRLHSDFARLCLESMGTPAVRGSLAKWLHNNGYLTFDRVPYDIRHWKPIDSGNDKIFNAVKHHCDK
ncbi:MAG: hypothetical protein O7E52_04925 [Candidatus Poribacteria bacterium]|nr:hypothetical protein [Candidatus Poribacteria bacterium]